MKFKAYVRRLRFEALFKIRPSKKRHPKYNWIVQDRSVNRHGGELINPVVVCCAGHIQDGRI